MDEWKTVVIPAVTAALGAIAVKVFDWLTARSDVNAKVQAAAAQVDLERDKFTIDSAFEMIDRLEAKVQQLEADKDELRAQAIQRDATIIELQGELRRMAYEHDVTTAELGRLRTELEHLRGDGK